MEYSQKAKEVNENRVLMRSGLKQEQIDGNLIIQITDLILYLR